MLDCNWSLRGSQGGRAGRSAIYSNRGGVPSLLKAGSRSFCAAMTQELCRKLAARGKFVPDIAIAGGFSSEDHIFKVLAMGSPFVKAVCMGRALMIPGMVGKVGCSVCPCCKSTK